MNMKQLVLLLCTLIVTATGTMSQSAQNGIGSGGSRQADPPLWGRYTVKGEEFSVTLPTVPAMTTAKVPRSDGKYRIERFLTTSLDGVFYSIEVFENPKPRQPLEEFIPARNA